MRKIFRILALLFLVQFCTAQLHAQHEPAYVNLVEGDSIHAGASFRVVDTVFFDAALKPTIVRTNAVHNMVTLRINEYSPLTLPDSFRVSVKISVEYVDTASHSDTTTWRILTINYNKARPYTNKSTFYFENAYAAKVHILDVTWDYGNTDNARKVIQLENRMVIDRDYAMSCINDAIQSILRDTSTVATMGDLKLTWQPSRVSEMYDVEWTYADQSTIDNGRYTTGGHLDPRLIFRNNASRLTTKADTCLIPLLYDGQGMLFYRIRGVQVNRDGELLTTEWSTSLDTTSAHWSYGFRGHQRNLNWQASTSFAEEGKSQSVVQYFDGSLRGRQTVTRNNTTQTTVVAETLYDQQGRPSIQVMPAPTLSKLIAYTPGFNVADMNSREYDKGIYDTLTGPSDYCALGADSMSVVSGASNYYSSQNPLHSQGFHQFIPDAGGFAFAETQYVQDNSGRVYRQGGVGPQFRIGTGHETKYYYGQPDQKELDALFGTEVGDASHYQKDMVRDPNGQYSVSYVDMHGHTVATALAGAAPKGLQALDSYRDTRQSEQLLTSTNNLINGNAIGFSSSFFMTKTDSVSLHYSVGKQSLKLADCRHDSICYDCLYDLTITVTGDCNNQVSGQDSKVVKLKNFSLFRVDTACGLAIPIDTTINMVLAEGSYVVTKELSINTDGMNQYRDSVYMSRNTCRTYDEILHLQLQILHDSLTCNQDTQSAATHTHYREQMLLDLYPMSGQYGDTATGKSCFSIFDKQGGRYLYQAVADTAVYLNANGQPDSVRNTAGDLVSPQNLTPEEFITNFNESWAPALLSLHPEYCLLLQTERIADSYDWDDDFEATDSYDAARTKGYLNPTGTTTKSPASLFPVNHTDPIFGYNFTTGARSSIEDSLFKMKAASGAPSNPYITAWGLAMAIVKAKAPISNDTLNKWNQPAFAMNADSLACTGDKDMAWRIFRGIYLTIKRNWVEKFIHTQCAGVPYPHQPCVPVFVRRDSVLASGGYGPYTGAADLTSGRDTANAFYASNCEAYRDRWREQLGTACYSEAQKTVIINYMVQVCKEGADSTHPFGASSVRPSSMYTYRSFDDAFRHVNDSISVHNVTCNSYLIDLPLPYNQSMFPTTQPLYTKPDSLTCNRITSLYTDYQAHSASYTSFSDYMLKVHNTAISNGALDTLRNLCSGMGPCRYLPTPIQLPPALQSAASTSCISCVVYHAAYDSFTQRFPGIVPVMQPADTSQITYNTIFANYLNNRFGFTKTAQDYLQFQLACDTFHTTITTLADTAFNCENLSLIYNTFRNEYPGVFALPRPAYDSDGVDVSNWTLNMGGSDHDMRYHFKDFVKDGILRTPINDSLSTGINFNYRNSFCVNGGFTMEVRLKFPIDSARKAMCGRNAASGLHYNLYGGFTYELFTNVGGPYMQNIYGNVTPNLNGAPYPVFFQYIRPAWLAGNRQNITSVGPLASATDTLTDWHIFRIVNKGGYVKSYLDTSLIYSAVNPYPVNTVGAFDISEFGYDLQIDWFKCYDGNDSLKLFEDFDDTNWSQPTFGRSCINDCQQRFTDYFNFHTNKSMTYSEIVKAYEACGQTITPCAGYNGPTLSGGNEPVNPVVPVPAPAPPCADSTNLAITMATQLEQIYRDSLIGSFNEAYTRKCLSVASQEQLVITKAVSEYHYTLYYYDQAGNLVKTVPPEGVHPDRTQTFLDAVTARRAAGLDTVPQHTLPTVYRYNTLNQVVSQKSPDGGRSQFWYDRLGRLAISQNAKQRATADYSYKRYDAIGRTVEVGQKHQTQGMSQAVSRDAVTLQKWIDFRNYDQNYWPVMVTLTGYDEPSLYSTVYDGQTPFHQKAYTLRNRVSYVRNFDRMQVNWGLSGTDTIYGPLHLYFNTAVEYSYNIHGNMDSMLNIAFNGTIMSNYGANAFKMIAYKYDLISGKVNEVHYNPGFADEFYHRYEYDADNCLTDVYTTENKSFLGQTGLEEHDAHYEFYKHGPLARAVLGQQQVQGMDYAYTLQGWLKGVNSSSLNPAHDMGGDGRINGGNVAVARDAIGFNLDYFTGDYGSISTLTAFAGHTAYMDTAEYKPLYNGNISDMVINIGALHQPQLYNYGYDQLNRIVKMDTYRGLDSATNNWSGLAYTADYKERVAYDANGNILKYLRQGFGPNIHMDSLTYHYNAGTNQLNYVHDLVSLYNYPNDVDDQSPNNFQYDSIGNLVADNRENLYQIDWNVYGKITRLFKHPQQVGDVTEIDYRYDPSGKRVQKSLWKYSAQSEQHWYVRDALGNVMAVYKMTYGWDFSLGALKLVEHHVYGSSRLGIIQRDQDMDSAKATATNESLLGATYVYTAERGNKEYELTNHLSNVLSTISDRKIGHGTGDEYDYYTADVVGATDYYPFGSQMPNRNIASSDYRYGFNGKENDNEPKGNGNEIDYGERISDPRLGKWLSVDPLQAKYPSNSPYNYAMNDPVNSMDVDGRDTIRFNRETVFIPVKHNLWGQAYGGGISQRLTVTVIKAPGEDKFFYDVTTISYQATGAPATFTTSREFFPNSTGKNTKHTGITYTPMGLLGNVADDDGRAFAKLAPPELIDAMANKNPKYEAFKTTQAFLALENGVERAHAIVTGIVTLVETGGILTTKKAFNIESFADEIINLNKKTEGAGVILGNGSPSSIVNSAMYYETPADQGSAIFRSIINNHLFVDGNKRTAVMAFQSFAKQFGLKTVSQEEMLNAALQVADKKIDDVSEISKLLIKSK